MNKATKAAILSALVFPGCGHFMLRSYLKGALLASAAAICLYLLLSNILEIANGISARIQTGEISMEVSQIAAAISEQLNSGGTGQINLITYILLACWVVSIVDSYRVGRSLHP